MESVATQTNLGILSDHAEASIVSANAKQIAAAQEQAPLTFIYSLAIEDTHFTYKEPRSDTAITEPSLLGPPQAVGNLSSSKATGAIGVSRLTYMSTPARS